MQHGAMVSHHKIFNYNIIHTCSDVRILSIPDLVTDIQYTSQTCSIRHGHAVYVMDMQYTSWTCTSVTSRTYTRHGHTVYVTDIQHTSQTCSIRHGHAVYVMDMHVSDVTDIYTSRTYSIRHGHTVYVTDIQYTSLHVCMML